ncbi:MAG: tetratricopeptide repeat protein [Prochlorothrix sp.]|nr:tetratricopeptide repeat protein [Prochlorothrix sp.]
MYGSCNQPQAQETCLRRALHCCGILQAARGRADTTQANSTQANPADWELALAIVEPLIDLYWHQNRWTDVTPLFPLALRIHQHRGSSEDRSVARILRRWGEVDLGQGRYAKAEVRLRAALNLYRQQKNAKTPTVAQCWYLLAQVYERQGREDKALALLEWLLAWSPLGTEDLCEVQVAIVLAIGPFYQARGQLSQHLQLYRQALKTCGPRLGSHHPHIQALQAQLLQLAPRGSYASPPTHVSTPRYRDPMV